MCKHLHEINSLESGTTFFLKTKVKSMKILITGATGLVGRHLVSKLKKNSQISEIRFFTRNIDKKIEGAKAYEWDPYAGRADEAAFEDIDAIIHLAGESVASFPWTHEKKEKILRSRTIPTQLLTSLAPVGAKLISASAVGFYGNRGDETLTSGSAPGQGFLTEVCQEWERCVFEREDLDACVIRIGIVLSTQGGALKTMLPSFKMHLGAVIGDGEQYMSWIHIDDLISEFEFLLFNSHSHKIFNGVAPSPVSNREFTETLGAVLDKKTLFSVPSFLLKAMTGDFSQILLNSQKVLPSEIQKLGFTFKHTQLKEALTDIIKHEK